jgi:hypothetical protein
MSRRERGVLGFRISAVHGLRLLPSGRCVCPVKLTGPRGGWSEGDVEEEMSR